MQNATVYTNLQAETTFGNIIQTNIWICFFVRIDSNSKIGFRGNIGSLGEDRMGKIGGKRSEEKRSGKNCKTVLLSVELQLV